MKPTRFSPLPFAPTAAIQAALAMRSGASMTVFEPQTQIWHHLTPTTDSDRSHRGREYQDKETPLTAPTAAAKSIPSVKGSIELIFSILFIVILTSIGSMALICFFFEMERHPSVLPVERQLAPKMTVK